MSKNSTENDNDSYEEQLNISKSRLNPNHLLCECCDLLSTNLVEIAMKKIEHLRREIGIDYKYIKQLISRLLHIKWSNMSELYGNGFSEDNARREYDAFIKFHFAIQKYI